jgi:membrane fusion protein (multidrug efflux system)
MSKGNGEDAAKKVVRLVQNPQSDPASPGGPVGNNPASSQSLKEWWLEARTPPRQDRPAAKRQNPEPPPEVEPPAEVKEEHPHETDANSGKPRTAPRHRQTIAVVGSVLFALAAGIGGYTYWNYAQHFESTDDAFIAARQIAIAPKVPGYITEVPVTDNQHVAAGAAIARIDDRDYRIALDQANAQVAAAQASIQNTDAQIVVQQAQVNASQAQVEQVQAALVFAQQQATRYEDLARKDVGTVQAAQQFRSQLLQQQAALKSAQAALVVARRQIDSLKAQRSSAEASLAQANAQRDQAQLNLSYTTVTAAQAGRVVNLTAAPGQFAQAGTNLTMFVPDEIWVTANFKETQLDAMRPGQPASMWIDAYPERAILGHVASIQPGSGTAFSLLPAQNATGNYVKVIQRVPVKIIIDSPPADVALGPGMSVVPSVRVNPEPSLYERLTSSLSRLWRRS